MKSRNRLGRSRRRGAAMAEGIVVISVMLGFLGLIQGAQNAYATKLRRQQDTRSATLYTASHACETGDSDPGGSAMPAVGGGSPGAAQGKTSASWNVAKSEWKGTSPLIRIEDRNAPAGNKGISLYKESSNLQIAALSRCVCNEPDYKSSNQFMAFFSFGIGMFKNLGGMAALFSIPGG